MYVIMDHILDIIQFWLFKQIFADDFVEDGLV